MRILAATIACAFALSAHQAHAAERYEFDKNHTNIMWFASHFGFSHSMGQFMDYDGHFTVDKENPENSNVTITIKTKSIMTGLDDFDEHLKGNSFFKTMEFPTATFTSTDVELADDDSARVTGDFTLLGVTKPVTLDVKMNKIGVNPYNQKHVAGFTAKTTIKRSDFGMKYALPGIHDDVNIHIEAEGIRVDEQ